MTGSVNFNPFLKNVQYVDLEQYEKIQKESKNEQNPGVNGDSQDEENVEVRLMSGDTERNYNAAKKAGMKPEIANDEAALRAELKKYEQIFIQNYLRQHPEIGEQELTSILTGMTDEFVAAYLQEVQNDPTIVMSDVVQEYEHFAANKIDNAAQEQSAAQNIVENEKFSLDDKYEALYNQVQYAQSSGSQNGAGISNSEISDIADLATDFVVEQFIHGDESFLNQVRPDYKRYYGCYIEACSYLKQYNSTDNPEEKESLINLIKSALRPMLSDVETTNKIAYFVNKGVGAPDGFEMPDSSTDKTGSNNGTVQNRPQNSHNPIPNINTIDKYSELYAKIESARHIFSQAGSGISQFEGHMIKSKSADLIIAQLLNGQGSIGLLQQLIPDYKENPFYQNAIKVLAGIEHASTLHQVNVIMFEAKNSLMRLLENTTGTDIANLVQSASMSILGGGNAWDFGMNEEQTRLYDAISSTKLNGGFQALSLRWDGTPNSHDPYNAQTNVKKDFKKIKQQLKSAVSNTDEYQKICDALDNALNEFNFAKYIQTNVKKQGGYYIENLTKEVLKVAMASLGPLPMAQMMEEGNDPFNRNLMESKFLVANSGRHIDKREKAMISKSYARYMIQALIADPSNVSLLSSVSDGKYFNSSTFGFESVKEVMQDIKKLVNNPPRSRQKFNQQINKITKKLEFLINKMDTSTLRNQIMTQGAPW